jgi:ribonuclease HI
MKIVLWRFAHNCLPTGQQLKLRNISADDLCCHCGRIETVEHAFLNCQYVVQIWKEVKKRSSFRSLIKHFVSPSQWIFETLAICTETEATILVISFWHIWEARNAVRNGENEVHPHSIVEKTLAYVDMVLLHMYEPVISNRCGSFKLKQWNPPPEGWVMVNVDAAVFQKANRMGWGIVIRNHRGDFLAASRQGMDKITNPELAEAIAFRQALLFVSGLPYSYVIIASDCLSLVHKLRSGYKDRSHTGIIVEDTKKAICVSSAVFSFIHVSRWCNEVAHVLARSAHHLSQSCWFHVAPSFYGLPFVRIRLNNEMLPVSLKKSR